MDPRDYATKRSWELGYSVHDIRSPMRHQRYVAVRRLIARELRDMGHSFPAIGDALNRDHSTIVTLLGGKASRGERDARRAFVLALNVYAYAPRAA